MTEDATIEQFEVDGRKMLFDAFKHLTTLSTGSILLLSALLKDFFAQPEWAFLVAVVLCCFLVSTVGSVIVMIAFGDTVLNAGKPTGTISSAGAISVFVSAISFLAGVFGLVVFAIKNFY